MSTKSRVRKKNGKPVKYKPKPKGISKTQMNKILKMIEDQKKLNSEGSGEIPETREEMGELLISPDFIKKLNVNPSSEVKEDGPELYSSNNLEEDNNEKNIDTRENIEENNITEGPSSSNI